LIDKLTFLKGGAEGGAASPDEERLMQLFKIAPASKKAYADLKDEFHLLARPAQAAEGRTSASRTDGCARDLLGDPKTGFGALVFFQLRALWKTCHQQLSAFAADLTPRQQEARELAKHQRRCGTEKNTRLADADQRLARQAPPGEQRRLLAEAQQEIGRMTASGFISDAGGG